MIIQVVGNAGEPLSDHRVVVFAPSTPEIAFITDSEGRVRVGEPNAGETFRLAVFDPGGIALGETEEITMPDVPEQRQVTVQIIF